MKIRKEERNDYNKVEELIKLAFLSAPISNGDEHKLVSRLRKSDKFIPELSMVAERDNQVIGHILLSKVEIVNKEGNTSHPCLALAPLSVHPEYQGQGIGSRLINEALEVAATMDYKSVLVLGYPVYYSKLGFQKAKEHGIIPPIPGVGDYLMVKCLGKYELKDIKGYVIYGKEFLI